MAHAFTPKRLYQGAVGTAAPASPYPYTVPASTCAQIRALQFTNTTAVPIQVTVWAIPSGQSAGAETVYLNSVAIPAYTDDPDERTLVLNAGDALAWQASASGLNVSVSGAEEGLS